LSLSLGTSLTAYSWTEYSIDPAGHATVGDDPVLLGAILKCSKRTDIGPRVLISYHVTIAESDLHPPDL
jgi:hypothetical protein